MKPTTNADRLDWDKPTFIVGEPCSQQDCMRPADGFLIAPNGEVIEGQVCRQCGDEAVAGRFEPGVVYKDWLSKNHIRGIPVRLKKEKLAHIGLDRVNRAYCGRNTLGLKTITAQEYLRSQRPDVLPDQQPRVCKGCVREVKKLVVTR